MKKLIILFTLLMFSAGVWANIISYTATEGLGAIKTDAFDLSVRLHSYNEINHTGIIEFDGDVTEIRIGAFQETTTLLSITFPNTIRKIEGDAFGGCTALTTITFEGSDCQNGIDGTAFDNVGSSTAPVTLILPKEWEMDNLPMNSQTKWHGGYFNSERTFEPYKQAALKAIGDALGEDAESDMFQDFITYYQSVINGANKSKFIDGVKDVAFAMIPIIKSTYTTGKTDGFEDGKAEALGEMATPCEECPVVEVTKGDKTVTFYAPEKVSYKKGK